MADLSGANVGAIQVEETQFKAAVSEYTLTRFGRLLNFFRLFHVFDRAFTMNGVVGFFANKQFVDGLWSFPYDAEIIDVVIYGHTMGTASAGVYDIKKSSGWNGTIFGAWTSIFSTVPQILFSAVEGASCSTGQTIPGFVAPVLTSPAILVSKGDRLRLDVSTVQAGISRDHGLIVRFRPR